MSRQKTWFLWVGGIAGVIVLLLAIPTEADVRLEHEATHMYISGRRYPCVVAFKVWTEKSLWRSKRFGSLLGPLVIVSDQAEQQSSLTRIMRSSRLPHEIETSFGNLQNGGVYFLDVDRLLRITTYDDGAVAIPDEMFLNRHIARAVAEKATTGMKLPIVP